MGVILDVRSCDRVTGHDIRFLFAAQFAHRHRLNLLSADLLNDRGARTLVDHGVVHDLDVRDVDGVVNDGGVVDDHRGGADWFQESPLLNKDKGPWRDEFHVHRHDPAGNDPRGRMQGCPANVAPALVPGNPRRGPLRLRHPIPAKLRAQIPTTIVIRGPGPRLITRPVPASFGALPMAVAVRSPIGFNAAGNPAATVSADHLPASVRSERLIKVSFVLNRKTGCGFHPHRRGRRIHRRCVGWWGRRIHLTRARRFDVGRATTERQQQRTT